MRRLLAIVGMIVLLGPAAADGAEITEIRLERTPCFGGCPVDQVILRPDGTATYIGTRFVPKSGRYSGTFHREDFSRLARLLESQGFFDMQDRYAIGATDMPSIITGATRGGATKTVVNYGDAGPIRLWGMERAIRGVAADIEWKEEQQVPGIHPRGPVRAP
jgi:hypothetical protein